VQRHWPRMAGPAHFQQRLFGFHFIASESVALLSCIQALHAVLVAQLTVAGGWPSSCKTLLLNPGLHLFESRKSVALMSLDLCCS